ncbi:MAG: cache domain-containing protein [bacterium]
MGEKSKGLRWRIFHKILLAMLIVALVPLGAIWYVSYRYSVEDLSRVIEERLVAASDKLAARVDDWVGMHVKALYQNGALEEIRSMKRERQDPVLKTILNEYKWSYLVFTTDLEGMNVGRSDDGKLLDYRDRKYVKDVVSGAPMTTQVLIGRTTGKPALIIAAPILAAGPGSQQKIQGVIAMAMHLTDLTDQIANLRIGKTGFAFLLDEGGFVIAHPDEEMTKSRKDLSGHPAFAARPNQGKKTVSFNQGDKEFLAVVQKTSHGWTLVTQQDRQEAYAPVREANQRALIMLGVTVILVILIAYLFSQRLAGPIRGLTVVAEQMSLGKFGGEIPGRQRRDEIGDLAQAIERLGKSVRLAIERLRAKSQASVPK